MTAEQLRELALAATPGPWTINSRASLTVDSAGHVVANCGSYSNNQRDQEELYAELSATAKFIAAANPATILDLLDRLAAAERERDEAYERAAVAAWHEGMDDYKRCGGLPADPREVGSRCAARIRALKGAG